MKRFIRILRSASLLPVILLSSCLDLDDSLFNPQKLSSYTLSTSVIPESQRVFVTLKSEGYHIYGYFVRSRNIDNDVTIVYFHGNKHHLQYYWDRVELLYRMGFNVFVFDYRGFGMSEGEPSEEGLYADGLAALNYVLQRPEVLTSGVVFYGFSLGNAVSFELAARFFDPMAVVAEAPFASAKTLVQSGTLVDIPSSYVMKGEYNNAEKAKLIRSPLLLLHGTEDKFIDIEKNSQVIFANANEPKRFVRIPGADHSEIPAKMGEQAYIDLIQTFINGTR